MSPLVVLSVLVGVAVAAAQVAIKPAVLQRYQPLTYASGIYPTQYSPYQPIAPAYKSYTPIAPYAAPIAPFAKPYAAPIATFAKPYAAPITPFAKPIQPYAVPVAPIAKPIQPYAAQPYYNGQYVKPIAIVRQNQDNNFDGSFIYDFEGENGISSRASGYVKAISPEEQAQVMEGEYSYYAPDGTPITTRWYADETGFHAEGAHLPTAQPDQYKTAKN